MHVRRNTRLEAATIACKYLGQHVGVLVGRPVTYDVTHLAPTGQCNAKAAPDRAANMNCVNTLRTSESGRIFLVLLDCLQGFVSGEGAVHECVITVVSSLQPRVTVFAAHFDNYQQRAAMRTFNTLKVFEFCWSFNNGSIPSRPRYPSKTGIAKDAPYI